MADDILFVGLDVHEKTISVATVLERPGESCRYYGSITNTPDALRRLCQKRQRRTMPRATFATRRGHRHDQTGRLRRAASADPLGA